MTEDITIKKTDGWTKIEKGVENTIIDIENVSIFDCRYRIGDSSNSVGHTFKSGMLVSLTTDMYVSIPSVIAEAVVTIVVTRIK